MKTKNSPFPFVLEEYHEIVKLWKDNKIESCEMKFSCGGDSMDDYEFVFYNNKKKQVECDELVDFFDEEVFKRVEFYVNSDGYYIGESGTVEITLDEGIERAFDYMKRATSEYSESFTETTEIELNEKEVDFISKYVGSIVGGDGGNAINYKQDLIVTDEIEDVSDKLLNKINDTACEYEFSEALGEPEDWYRFSTRVDGEDVLLLDENKLSIDVSRNHLMTSDSELLS